MVWPLNAPPSLPISWRTPPEGPLRCPVTGDVLERDFVISHELMRVEMDEYGQEQATAARAMAASIVGRKRPAGVIDVGDEPLSRVAKRAVVAEKPFACDQCDYRCTRNYNLRAHQMTHTGEI